ncbi:threonine--tRNA ligase [Emcibacter sp. SYSU 3D8]|uniref:threonine--tRNA ligase n=1 Tax=Emcibacter sp. SYSU 3D8 TaxID=3133969 RepID=UPI0031FE613B
MDDLDHRSLGSRLELFHQQDDAPGMVFWHPHGYAVYRVLEDYIRRRMRRLGYAEVRTPLVLPRVLWERSGHWEKFRDNMFLVADEGGREMALKPMSCPCHVQIFNKGLRSWRELPIRYAEFGQCHRNEPSGSMHGLMRTRGFEQDDAHVFCREEQAVEEMGRFIDLLDDVYTELGFAGYEVALATRPAERAGSDAQWDWAEARLDEAARSRGLSFSVKAGEGAFYGPKLEFILRDRLGRTWQCGTVQLDCVLPERLDASYVAPDGSRAVPVMIHHAVFGSMGRFVGVLLEHYGAALPFWLAPEQVAVAPVSDRHGDYARQVWEALDRANVRAVMRDGNETLPRRIVAAHEAGIPAMAIVGDLEAAAGTVALRRRDGSQSVMQLSDAVALLAAPAT